MWFNNSMTTKQIMCKPGDKRTREVMRQAHEDGRHGDGSKLDVLVYWAGVCYDCNAQHYYEHVKKI